MLDNKVIVKEDIPSLLLEACPSFKDVYDDSNDKELDYIIAGDFSVHLLSLYKKNHTSEFPAVADLIENFHVYGDKYVQDFVTIGILESIQNQWGGDIGAEHFEPFLLPVSKKYWQSLNDFWQKKVPYVGFGIE